MTKDFKKHTTTDGSFGQYGLGWMLGGIAIGLLVGAGMYALANKNPNLATQALTPTQETQVTTTTTQAASPTEMEAEEIMEKTSTASQFSYHAVLPQLEIEIPDSVKEEQTKRAEAKAKPQQASKIPANRGYNGLQIGSYKTERSALRAQAQLQQQGLASLVEQATSRGTLWYRVRIGPTDSHDKLEQLNQTLSNMGIIPMPVRM